MLSSVDALEERARELALKLLERGPKSSLQLREALAKADIPAAIIDALLERFAEVSLVDDKEFARTVTTAVRATKGLSRAMVRRKLSEKGLDSGLVEEVVGEISDEQELESARAVAQKRFTQLSSYDETTRQRRLFGYLQRRGYSSAIIASVTRDLER